MGEVESLLYGLWSLWSNRNRCLHDQVCSSALTLAHKVRVMIDEAGKQVTNQGHGNGREEVENWCVPPLGVIKVNTDAAYKASNKTASLGMVARNSDGEVLISAVKRMSQVQSALHAEIFAIILSSNMQGVRVPSADGGKRFVKGCEFYIAG
ncbi:hypothetical protein REPUB_Repub09cG0061100 [Reevesia pubescens]